MNSLKYLLNLSHTVAILTTQKSRNIQMYVICGNCILFQSVNNSTTLQNKIIHKYINSSIIEIQDKAPKEVTVKSKILIAQ